MLGLLVAGCALARRHHVLVGLVLCALAAQVKLPALIGAVFIGWWWSDASGSWRQRLGRVVAAAVIVVSLMGAISAVSNLGWHWLNGLANPGTVVSWLDPATALGLALGHAASALGLGEHTTGLVDNSRGVGLGAATVLSIGLLLRSKRRTEIAALGWSLLLFVILGPVVWPWYETCGSCSSCPHWRALLTCRLRDLSAHRTRGSPRSAGSYWSAWLRCTRPFDSFLRCPVVVVEPSPIRLDPAGLAIDGKAETASGSLTMERVWLGQLRPRQESSL
jgi:hypothetical protein